MIYTKKTSSIEDLEVAFHSFKNLTVDDPYVNACMFYLINRVSFSGTSFSGGFSKSAARDRFTEKRILSLWDMPPVLKDVVITCRDAFDVVRDPGEDVFLFLDPPYVTADKLYGVKGDLHQFDHVGLAEELRKTPHKFLLTYDDCPAIRDLYKGFNLHPYSLQYGMSVKVGHELAITNY
jgi:DNA adenine methylase